MILPSVCLLSSQQLADVLVVSEPVLPLADGAAVGQQPTLATRPQAAWRQGGVPLAHAVVTNR